MAKYRVQSTDLLTESIASVLTVTGARMTELPDGLPHIRIEPRVGQGLKITNTTTTIAGHLDTEISRLDLNVSPTGALGYSETGQLQVRLKANGGLTVDANNELSVAAGAGGSTTLGGLNDVTITTPLDNQILRYQSSSGQWINVTAAFGSQLAVYDETTLLTTSASALRFVGSAVTATAAGTDITVTVTPQNQTISLTGDASGSGTSSIPVTLATVNAGPGTYGQASQIPVVTVNGKGLVTSVSTVTVIAPAGTLTGTTLASNVVSSSLTSVGTLTGLAVSGLTTLGTYSGTTGGADRLRIAGDVRVGGTIYATDFVLAGGLGGGTGLTLNSLDDVTIGIPSPGVAIGVNQVLQYDGSTWRNSPLLLNEISGVVLTTPTTGQVLQFNGTNWVNGTAVGGVTSFAGLTGAITLNDTNFFMSGQQLQLNTVGTGKGGTGLITTPTSNQILLGTGSGYSLVTLNAGTGIQFNNSGGFFTISSTATGGVTSFGGQTGAITLGSNLQMSGTQLQLSNVITTSNIGSQSVSSAAQLTTARTIAASGDVSWSVSFNGSQNVSGTATLNNIATAGTYRSVTVTAQGRVTSGTNPTTLGGYGITDAVSTSGITTTRQYKVGYVFYSPSQPPSSEPGQPDGALWVVI
jgi:hypothetical protein